MTNANYGYRWILQLPYAQVFASYRQQATDPAIVVWPARRAGDTMTWTAQYLQQSPGLLDQSGFRVQR